MAALPSYLHIHIPASSQATVCAEVLQRGAHHAVGVVGRRTEEGYWAAAVVKAQVTLGPLVQASRTTCFVPGFSGELGKSVGLP